MSRYYVEAFSEKAGLPGASERWDFDREDEARRFFGDYSVRSDFADEHAARGRAAFLRGETFVANLVKVDGIEPGFDEVVDSKSFGYGDYLAEEERRIAEEDGL